jgi:hypothetical protein
MNTLKILAIILTVIALAVPTFMVAASFGRPEVRACVKFVHNIVPEAPILPVLIDCHSRYSH